MTTVLAGCGRLGFTAVDDAMIDANSDVPADVPADACTLGPWSTPAPATGLNSADDDWDSAIHPSGTYIVFSRRTGGSGGPFELYGATVTGTQFGTPVLLGALNTTSDDEGPAWSPDGTTLYMISNVTGSFRVYTSTFDGTSFSPPAIIASLATTTALGPHITQDDLEMYYSGSQTSPEMHRATRASPGDPWTDQGPVPELNSTSFDGYATVSFDGLTMYWDSGRSGVRSLWSATRAQPGATWGTPMIQTAFNAPPALTADPDLSRDGRMMLFSSSRPWSLGAFNLWFTTRTCL